jgi:hypothetical protein
VPTLVYFDMTASPSADGQELASVAMAWSDSAPWYTRTSSMPPRQ